jgi:hypothetical protein
MKSLDEPITEAHVAAAMKPRGLAFVMAALAFLLDLGIQSVRITATTALAVALAGTLCLGLFNLSWQFTQAVRSARQAIPRTASQAVNWRRPVAVLPKVGSLASQLVPEHQGHARDDRRQYRDAVR